MIETDTVARRRITDRAALRELVGSPSERAIQKQLAALGPHSRMIGDQTRPIERSDAAHDAIVEAGERATAEAYRCLY